MTEALGDVDDGVSLKSRLVDIPRRTILRTNARLGHFDDDVVWLLGAARSGTTWVSDLVNHAGRYREMFEPIRPRRVEPTAFLTPHQYVRPGTEHEQLHELMDEIFSGRFTHPRIDTANRRLVYDGLLVKDCFANLLARWACENFPHVRPVLLIRNPFAVALSTRKKPRWYWPIDPADLISQPDLVDDHLEPQRDVLARVAADGDELQSMLATWAVINMVPLRQFARDDVHVCFYEEIFERPDARLREMFAFTGRSDSGAEVVLEEKTVKQPSRMASEHSTIVNDTSPLTTWRDELTTAEIDRGAALLDELGIGDLYGDAVMPDRAVLDGLRG